MTTKFQKQMVQEVRDHAKKLPSTSNEKKLITGMDDSQIAEVIGKVRSGKGALRRIRHHFAKLDEARQS